MKFLKINFEKKTKKIVMKPEYKNFENFMQIICEISKLPKEELTLSFLDIENEVTMIEDCHDLEYFYDQLSEGTIYVVDVQKKSEKVEQFSKEEVSEVTLILSEVEKKVDVDVKVEVKEQALEEIQFMKPELIVEPKVEKVEKESEQVIIQNNKKDKKCDRMKKERKEKKVRKCTSKKRELFKNLSPQKIHFLKGVKKVFKKKVSEIKDKMREMKKEFGKDKSKQEIKDMLVYMKEIKRGLKRKWKQMKKKIIENEKNKVEKKTDNAPTVSVLTTHIGVTCDNCKVYPIVGKRYKCMECFDFDLCENCENKNFHLHPMMRFTSQANRCGFNSCSIKKTNIEKKEEKVVENKKVEEKIVEDLQTKEKRELLDFMFESKDEEAKKELLERFKNLNIEQFYLEISKN
jgi:hypothetical protein